MYLSHICTSVGTKDANNLIQGDRKEIDCTHDVFKNTSMIYTIHIDYPMGYRYD
jgi:hypothetical protein